MKYVCETCGREVVPVEGVTAMRQRGYWWCMQCVDLLPGGAVDFPSHGKLIPSTILLEELSEEHGEDREETGKMADNHQTKWMPEWTGVGPSEYCVTCNGECCRRQPGLYHPSDFGNTPEEIEERLVAGFTDGTLQVDWWEGDPRADKDELSKAEFIRPTALVEDVVTGRLEREHRIYLGLWRGTCIHFLPSKGCALSMEDRPLQCRMLVPRTDGHGRCRIGIYDKQWVAIEWMPYADVIERAADRAKGTGRKE